jgi:peptidyl-prolyl cis-trans isomerase A (cyclophilin A)
MKRWAMIVAGVAVLAWGCSEGAGSGAPKAPAPPPEQEKPKEQAPADKKAIPDPDDKAVSEKAPAEFKVKFVTSKGDVVLKITRDWSPNGADRFYNLVKCGYYDDVRFFRVISGFMAQFGIHGDPKVSAKWSEAKIEDDSVKVSNTRGRITYAKTGLPNSRSTQLFINYKDNSRLDKQGFSPFGEVVEGMEVVDKLYSGYGEGAPSGRGPSQGRIVAEGNAYLNKDFKDLDFIKTAQIVP